MDDEFVRGSGNTYQNFGHANTVLERTRAVFSAKIIQIMDERGLSTRDTERLTGVCHTEFSRIRNAKLHRFTLDRIITILGKLDEQVEINITFNSRTAIK